MKNIKNILLFFLILFCSETVLSQCTTCDVRMSVEGCSIVVQEVKSGQTFVFDQVTGMMCNMGQVTLSNGFTTATINNSQVRTPRGINTDPDSLCSFVEQIIDCVECCEPDFSDVIDAIESIDSLTVDVINNYVKGEGNMVREEKVAGTYQMAAGSYYCYVRNSGCVTITVNGQNVSPNGIYQCGSQTNEVTQIEDCCPSIDIVIPANGNAWCSCFYPSN